MANIKSDSFGKCCPNKNRGCCNTNNWPLWIGVGVIVILIIAFLFFFGVYGGFGGFGGFGSGCGGGGFW